MADDAGEDRGAFSAAVLCRLLDITEQRFHQLVKQGVIPKLSRGKYPLAATVRSYIRYIRQTGSSQLSPEDMDPFKRRAHYEAEMSRLQLERTRGDLVPRIEVEQEQGRVAKIVSEGLETLPDILERDTGATPRQLRRIEEIIDKIRSNVFEQLTAKAEDDVRASA